MLNFVYTFQATVIFLAGIVSLILAKLELFLLILKSFPTQDEVICREAI